MANNDVMTLDKQLAALEVTVAKGFQNQRQVLHEHGRRLDEHTSRFDRLEDRMAALEAKLDIVSQSICGDIRTVIETMSAFIGEMRHTTDSMRREGEVERRLTKSVLLDHSVRIRNLEGSSARNRKRRSS